MNLILQLDQDLFLWIQHHCHTEFLDILMPWLRNKYSWMPLYLFLIVLIVYKYRYVGVRMILIAIVCVTCSDLLSSRIAKPLFKRLRPCEDTTVALQFTPAIPCGNRGYSFTSSHAANHFALAFGLGLFFFQRKKWLLATGIVWAGSISLAQVYVGVHYPLDILGGALLGIGIAWMVHWLLRKYLIQYFNY